MKLIKSLSILLLLSLFMVSNIQGQEKKTTNLANIGFNISQIQKDFGIGVHFITPYFCNQILAVKIGGNLQWFEYANPETIWKPYGNLQIGIRARRFIIEDKINIYGEGGTIMILPNKNFSSKKSHLGGYGLFGFEFKPSPKFGYFIELGGVGTGAKADKVATNPIYSNGFITNVGLRVSL